MNAVVNLIGGAPTRNAQGRGFLRQAGLPIATGGTELAAAARWQAVDIQLPPLRNRNGAGDSFGIDLNRQASWQMLRASMAGEGRRLVPYSFRHTYSPRGH